MNKIYITWQEVLNQLQKIDHADNIVYGVPTGGMVVSSFLKKAKVTHNIHEANLILDDIYDSGETAKKYKWYVEKKIKTFWHLFDKRQYSGWLVMPWENEHPSGPETVEKNITRELQYIGEDVNREGLKDTPSRVIKMYGQVFSGYDKDPKDILTIFDSDGYDQIILLKDIELYSMCEHHMLPFFGKAHVAYIPDKKIIGISKLARLVDIYSKRLQIQERIGDQVTKALMEHLQPLGAACIIEANHLCMRMRGVQKQNSIMTTSSMKGAFFDKKEAREELLELIRMQ